MTNKADIDELLAELREHAPETPCCDFAADIIEKHRAAIVALEQMLDDMGEDGLCVCQQAKDDAQASLAAQGIETQSAMTAGHGPQDESPVAESDAPKGSGT